MNAKKMFVSSVAVFLFGLAPALFAEPADTPSAPPQQDENAPAMNQPAPPPDGPQGMNCPQMRQGKGKSCEGRPGMQRKQFGKARQGAGFIPRAPMSEEDMAKFADLTMKLRDALEDYRTTSDEKTKAAVKTAVTALVDAQQKFEIDRCEKALARAKAKVQEKDSIIDRILKRLTSPKADRHGMKGGRHGAKGERPMPPQNAPDKE